jgi:hypothetical protein
MGASMVYVYILIVVIALPIIGKLVTRRSDGAYTRSAQWGSMKGFKFSRFSVDPEENPRPVGDGTDYGYKEFD